MKIRNCDDEKPSEWYMSTQGYHDKKIFFVHKLPQQKKVTERSREYILDDKI